MFKSLLIEFRSMHLTSCFVLLIYNVCIHTLQVGYVPVTCKRIPLLALEYEPPKSEVIAYTIFIFSEKKCFADHCYTTSDAT